ncbi:hypothetical protein HRG_009317 [Hirsutella rhossiliensis]|uniref:2EXR domain-containing protein n=1 Tax=Hirsutella rhossiliensis TaxID=111463 RepID=A0A9P8MQS8_9HYPO|nr:uncharacterized protein HRG_09317 [Hirsutella rhossiliensis]KAH0959535.1 hypothetical protein HRG_09317 [Hirsutella rhossiliensis]
MMDCTFPLFPRFPLEIRQQIWRTALAQYWSFTKLKRAGGGGVKLVGEVHRNVGQSCREARAAMQTTHAETRALGWVDFGRHVFFFRDAKFDRGLMTALEHDGDDEILPLVQHVVVNPRDWSRLWETIDVIKSRCASLRTLVVVAPWFDPADMPASHSALSYAPYEDWGQVYDKTPTEMQLSPLRDAIERGAAANSARNDEYRAKLDEAAAQVTDDDNVEAFEHVFGRTRLALQKLEQAVQEFPSTKPRLYLRTKEELISPTTVQ